MFNISKIATFFNNFIFVLRIEYRVSRKEGEKTQKKQERYYSFLYLTVLIKFTLTMFCNKSVIGLQPRSKQEGDVGAARCIVPTEEMKK